jgi:hypothetical protein
MPLVLVCLPDKPKLTFILDRFLPLQQHLAGLGRTNWQLGQTHVHVLVLSVLYQTTSIPLLWEFLAAWWLLESNQPN